MALVDAALVDAGLGAFQNLVDAAAERLDQVLALADHFRGGLVHARKGASGLLYEGADVGAFAAPADGIGQGGKCEDSCNLHCGGSTRVVSRGFSVKQSDGFDVFAPSIVWEGAKPTLYTLLRQCAEASTRP